MKRALLAASTLLLVLLALVAHWLWPAADFPASAPPSAAAAFASAAQVERGRYLALAGDCKACHTERGGAAYAGGRAIPTPFGTFFAPNITPDEATGIGAWSADDFWRALHEGRGRDGKPLYPAFPYTNYTRITRSDADDLYAYLRSLPPVRAANRPHQLRFPYRYRALLRGWRLLYFRPGEYEPDPGRSAGWNRGAYLVEGLGHCSACHEARNALGAVRARHSPAGGVVLNWYAPSLQADDEAGVGDWSPQAVIQLLQTGTTGRASTLGPMAEVVFESLQYLRDDDLAAMAEYLTALPEPHAVATPRPPAATTGDAGERFARGARVYRDHCQDCHGEQGQGVAPAAPPLAGNRALTMRSAVNPIRVVLYGGYPPGTAGNPRPFGMPPFAPTLPDADIAEVLSYVRNAWGNSARPVSAVDVARNRAGPLW